MSTKKIDIIELGISIIGTISEAAKLYNVVAQVYAEGGFISVEFAESEKHPRASRLFIENGENVAETIAGYLRTRAGA